MVLFPPRFHEKERKSTHKKWQETMFTNPELLFSSNQIMHNLFRWIHQNLETVKILVPLQTFSITYLGTPKS